MTDLIEKNGALAEANVYDGYGKVTIWDYSPGDFDRDGDVDATDQISFNAAKPVGGTGSGVPAKDPMADLDMDGDVDNTDSTAFTIIKNAGGAVTEAFVSSIGNPFFFTGRRLYFLETLPEVSSTAIANQQLQHNRARDYLPDLGRWGQRDPIGCRDALNSYEYVAAQPYRKTDPQGLTGDDQCARTGKWEWNGSWNKETRVILGNIAYSTPTPESGMIIIGLNAFEVAYWTRSYRDIFKCKIGTCCILEYGRPGCRWTRTKSDPRTDAEGGSNGGYAEGIMADPSALFKSIIKESACGEAIRTELEALIGKETGKLGQLGVFTRWREGTMNEAPEPDPGEKGTVGRKSQPPRGTMAVESVNCVLDRWSANSINEPPICTGNGCK